jgi:DNA repair ATPase RecN
MTPEEVKVYIGQALGKASNFKRVGLQIHSDDSTDFPRENDYGAATFAPSPNATRTPSAEVFLAAAKDKRLDLIAITDHMKSRKSCEISALSQKTKGPTVALPGIEVNILLSQVSGSTPDAVHMLCIFREGTSSEDIERTFHDAKGLRPYEQRDASDAIEIDLKSFVHAVHSNSGLSIASHVNSDKGLRRTFFSLADRDYVLTKRERELLQSQEGQADWTSKKFELLRELIDREKKLADMVQNKYLQFLADAGIDAVQIQKSTEGQFYRGEHCELLQIHPLAAVLMSDAHCLEAIGYEAKITYVKMTYSSWENLRAALQDPETRIRYADTVGTHNYTKIKGIVFVTTDGFFKGIEKADRTYPQAIGFADNLTCLIGGRGAGKSAVIDALRYMFKRKEDVDSLPDKLSADIRGRLDHALKETAIHVLLESDDGEEVVVKSFYSGWSDRTYESAFLTGEDAGIDPSASPKYRAEIYGWNEIETLGTDSGKQLYLLDRFIDGLKQIDDQILESKRKLSDNRAAINSSAEKLSDLIPSVKDFEEAKSSYEKINTPEMEQLFSDMDKLSEVENTLQGIFGDFQAVRSTVTLDYGLEARLSELASQITDLDLRRRVLGEANFGVKRAMEGYQALTEVLDLAIVELRKEIEAIRAKKAVALEALSTVAGADVKAVATVDKRLARKKRYEQLVAQKAKIKAERINLTSLLIARKTLIGEYEHTQSERTQKRNDTKNEINTKLSTAIRRAPVISIDFYERGDRREFQKRLGTPGDAMQREPGILKGVGVQYMDRRFAEIISKHNTPAELVEKILDTRSSDLAASHGDGKDSIGQDDCKRIFNHLTPSAAAFGEEYYDPTKLDLLLSLQEIELNDLPEITLDGQPIAELSPGQRCSALVPIVLLQGTHPLIIDQPEDNLDNKLVFSLVVEILRNLKEHRQIIVATHNPNIPVSGDAEQILVFESQSKTTGRITLQGSIDDETVIEAVKDIMEGGSAAFLTRAQKYRYELMT